MAKRKMGMSRVRYNRERELYINLSSLKKNEYNTRHNNNKTNQKKKYIYNPVSIVSF